MTDPRKPIFDAVRALARPGLFNDPGNILALDNLLDAFNVPRAGQAKPSAPVPAAPAAGAADPIPAGYFDLLAKIESNNRPYVKASTSSASGLYQFIRSTWRGEGGQWGPDMSQAFGGLRPSIEEQRQRARSFTMKNVEALHNAGVPVNSASLYAAHFLGVGTAIKMLRARLDASAASVAGTAATAANPSILGRGRTVAGFRQWLESKTGVKP
jgi:hypothetical protein